MNAAFAEVAARALSDHGIIYLRTDDAPYFGQMEQVFGANESFARDRTPEELLGVKTDFEREFNAKGIATNHAAWRKIAGSAPVNSIKV